MGFTAARNLSLICVAATLFFSNGIIEAKHGVFMHSKNANLEQIICERHPERRIVMWGQEDYLHSPSYYHMHFWIYNQGGIRQLKYYMKGRFSMKLYLIKILELFLLMFLIHLREIIMVG